MASSLVIPALLEKNLALGDGSTAGGCPTTEALGFDRNVVANLYSISEGELKFAFQEHGVAYNETTASSCLVEAAVELHPGARAGFSVAADANPVQMWGVNFAGRVVVKHQSGEEREIYLPGTRTYDPAGLTGDPHASERIGPSCSRAQIGITVVELIAAIKGAELDQVNALHKAARTMVKRYHGREILFDWMELQVEEAVYKKTVVTPYPEYIKALIREGKLVLLDSREHTKAYLRSYNSGLAHPPVQYYRKVGKKDDVQKILNGEQLAIFKKVVE